MSDIDSKIYELLQPGRGRAGKLGLAAGGVRLPNCMAVHGRANRAADVRVWPRERGDHVPDCNIGGADEVLKATKHIQVHSKLATFRRKLHF